MWPQSDTLPNGCFGNNSEDQDKGVPGLVGVIMRGTKLPPCSWYITTEITAKSLYCHVFFSV